MLRKRVPPAIYNANRIFERPIPQIPLNGQEVEKGLDDTCRAAIRGFILRSKQHNVLLNDRSSQEILLPRGNYLGKYLKFKTF